MCNHDPHILKHFLETAELFTCIKQGDHLQLRMKMLQHVQKGHNFRGRCMQGVAGLTLLHASVLASADDATKLKMTRTILELGGCPNAKDGHGRTPLFYAARQDNGELTRVLLKYGADHRIKDLRGRSSLVIAAASGSVTSLHMILTHLPVQSGIVPSLDLPELQGDASRIVYPFRPQLPADVDATVQDNSRRSLLSMAALGGHEKTVRRLLSFGANPNIKDVYGATTLHVALQSDHFDIFKMLLSGRWKHPVDVNSSSRYADPPWYYAISKGEYGRPWLKVLAYAGATFENRCHSPSLEVLAERFDPLAKHFVEAMRGLSIFERVAAFREEEDLKIVTVGSPWSVRKKLLAWVKRELYHLVEGRDALENTIFMQPPLTPELVALATRASKPYSPATVDLFPTFWPDRKKNVTRKEVATTFLLCRQRLALLIPAELSLLIFEFF